eukprot:COSAG01_NODE_48896_length_377_cov_0.550360_2_plen_60_part_01
MAAAASGIEAGGGHRGSERSRPHEAPRSQPVVLPAPGRLPRRLAPAAADFAPKHRLKFCC